MNKLATLLRRCVDLMHGVPHTLIALLGRFSIAAVFWLSGQTKLTSGGGLIEGDQPVPAYIQALLEQTAESLDNLQRTIRRVLAGIDLAHP